MLRINEESKGQGHRRLKLEGSISGPWVRELNALCGDILRESSKLTLDLSAISFVDAAAAGLLRGLARQGVRLTGESPFVARQLDQTEE